MRKRLSFVFAVLAILGAPKFARAIETSNVASQFVRQQWTAQNGLSGGHVRAITQTPDGYLWIATEDGLVRFDGFSFRPISFGPPAQLSNSSILGLTTDAEGDLLVRVQGAIVIRHPNGEFERLASAPGSTTSYVTAMWKENDGGVLLWDLMSGLLRYRNGQVEVLAHRRGSLGKIVISITQTPDGKIWVGALGAGLSSATHDDIITESGTIPGTKASCLLPMGETQVLVGTDKGLFRWNGSALSSIALPPSVEGAQILTLLRDHNGHIWAGTTRGLVRINADGSSVADEGDAENGVVNALFEDREGNIWAGGADGLQRIRESTFLTYPTAKDDNPKQEGPIYVDGQNRAWFAPLPGRLLLLNGGRTQEIKSSAITNDVIYSIAGRRDEIWLGTQHGGLTHFRYINGIADVQTYTHANGLAENSVYSIFLSQDGAVWAGTLTGGVSKLNDKQFTTYTLANGLASNTVSSITQTRDGTMWFGTPNGLSSLVGDHWTTYGMKQGLPSNEVFCLFEDASGVLWIGTSSGLASIQSGHVHLLLNPPDSLRQPVLGIAADRKGGLWIATTSRVLRMQSGNLSGSQEFLSAGAIREYGEDDGLRSTEGVKRSMSVVSDPAGKVWFSLDRGVSVVDPSHIADNSAPALAHIETISADNAPVDLAPLTRIPPSRKRITFAYTGLSLAEPGNVRFRYYLESFDHGWSEPTAARDAAYTNLGPGNYRFHLIASNSDGLWNGPETFVTFRVEPAVWQTWWFRSLCVLVMGLATVSLYLMRMQQLTRQLNVRFEERLGERLRIARDLHDTLLQGVQGLTLRFHYAMRDLPPSTKSRDSLENAIEAADNVVLEARNQVMRLRSELYDNADLPKSLRKVAMEMNHENVTVSIVTKGAVSALRPSIGEELFFIGREAITNALNHAQPSEVRVELDYARKSVRLCCKDNGIGMNPTLLQGGPPDGHWGLLGMRERAERLGGELTIRSQHTGGTEVIVTVPARLAYVKRSGILQRLISRMLGRTD